MAFKIKHIRPLFTGVVTTANKYVSDTTIAGGLILDMRHRKGELNPYQTVICAGPMCNGIKDGDIVKINFKRYMKVNHIPGVIDQAQNTQADTLQATYEIPIIELDGKEYLNIQYNDLEYVVDDYDVDEGGLLE